MGFPSFSRGYEGRKERFPIPNSVRNEAGLELSAPACGVWNGYPFEKKVGGVGGGRGRDKEYRIGY